MLTRKEIDQQRLDKVLADIDLLALRFPIATIAKRTGCDKRYVSKMISGKLSCSDTFISRFYISFQADLENARINMGVINVYSGNQL